MQQAADMPSTSRGLCVFRWVLLVVGSYDWNSSSPWELCHAPVYHLPVLQTFSIQQSYEAPIPIVTEGRPRRCSPVWPWQAQNSSTIYRCSHAPFSWHPVLLTLVFLWRCRTLWHSGEMTPGHSFHRSSSQAGRLTKAMEYPWYENKWKSIDICKKKNRPASIFLIINSIKPANRNAIFKIFG